MFGVFRCGNAWTSIATIKSTVVGTLKCSLAMKQHFKRQYTLWDLSGRPVYGATCVYKMGEREGGRGREGEKEVEREEKRKSLY